MLTDTRYGVFRLSPNGLARYTNGNLRVTSDNEFQGSPNGTVVNITNRRTAISHADYRLIVVDETN